MPLQFKSSNIINVKNLNDINVFSGLFYLSYIQLMIMLIE